MMISWNAFKLVWIKWISRDSSIVPSQLFFFQLQSFQHYLLFQWKPNVLAFVVPFSFYSTLQTGWSLLGETANKLILWSSIISNIIPSRIFEETCAYVCYPVYQVLHDELRLVCLVWSMWCSGRATYIKIIKHLHTSLWWWYKYTNIIFSFCIKL